MTCNTVPKWKKTNLEEKYFQYFLNTEQTSCPSSLKNYVTLCGMNCFMMLWRACNLTAFTPCLTGPVDYPFASRNEGPGLNPKGGTYSKWNQDSPVSVVSLHWWPWSDWSLWPHLRWASYRTVTRPSCRQCDNPTWSHTALLSRFQACCRLHNWHSRHLGGESCGEPAISLHSHHVSLVQWTTRLLPVMRDPGSFPRGVLMWNRDSPISVVSLQCTFII
jgi:hypothetical protein